jgi:hypothetical protein
LPGCGPGVQAIQAPLRQYLQALPAGAGTLLAAALFLLSWFSPTIFVATGIAIAINSKAIIKGICANPFLFIMKKVNHYFH